MFKKYPSLLLAPCALALLVLCGPVSALAAEEGPQWTVTAFSTPTNLAPGGTGLYRVYAQNTGGAPSNGEVTVADVLPAGLKATAEPEGTYYEGDAPMKCGGLTCTYAGVVGIDDTLEVTIPVEAEASVPKGRLSRTSPPSRAGGPRKLAAKRRRRSARRRLPSASRRARRRPCCRTRRLAAIPI